MTPHTPTTDMTNLVNGSMSPHPTISIEKGTAYAMFAYDVGFAIDLDLAEQSIAETKQRDTIRRKRRAPSYFEYKPAPLRVSMSGEMLDLGSCRTDGAVDFVLFDFGAVSVTYRIPLGGRLADLVGLANCLYDNEELLADSRRGVERLVATLGPAISKRRVADLVEDYVIYHIHDYSPTLIPADIVRDHALSIAQTLRAESDQLAPEVIADALSTRISFTDRDLAIIDWNAALLFDPDADDVLAVLEYANVELLEMRYLDDKLDGSVGESYEAFSRTTWARARGLRARATDVRRIAELQLDSALLFEGVNNAVKLMGDQYLARVYRLAVQRLHLDEWDASVIRKLNTLESIYQKTSDQQSAWRMEVLEWIIIILITVSIIITFIPGLGAH